MAHQLLDLLKSETVEAEAPCRIDMGGTLDIATFYYPLRHLDPCTFNLALDLKTRVRLLPFEEGRIKVSSKGFETADHPADEAPFDHPLGMIFAIAAYFQADGVHIDIASDSPPRSALGGSSTAAVALVGAFSNAFFRIGAYRQLYRREIAMLAHALEESVARIPCGLQDQLAAAYGGVNAWYWHGRVKEGAFEKETLMKKQAYAALEKRLLIAYCGEPHASADINNRWVAQFLAGKNRETWREIIRVTHRFIRAVREDDWASAAAAMNRETDLRMEMTPEVLNPLGRNLLDGAREMNCGARFTGAGGGGCIWALGETNNIDRLRDVWEKRFFTEPDACLLNAAIDSDGLRYTFE